MKKFFTFLLISIATFAYAQVNVQNSQQQPQNAPISLTPLNTPMQNMQMQQPSPEELEKQRQVQLELKKQQLQKEFFPEIKPITDKIGETFIQKYKYWLIGGIIILATILLLLLRPKKKPELTPYQEAKLRFETLEKIANSLEVKPYAEELSQIVRDYIDKVYSIPAPERTTQEFLELAKMSNNFDDDAKGELASILKLADMAKFAKHSFSNNERTQIFETSVKFIENDNTRVLSKNSKQTNNEL